MKKNKIHPYKQGDVIRMSYANQLNVISAPNLIQEQLNSFQRFLDYGINEILKEASPIVDFNDKLILEYLGYSKGEPKYTIGECKEYDANYAVPMKLKVRLINKVTEEINEQETI